MITFAALLLTLASEFWLELAFALIPLTFRLLLLMLLLTLTIKVNTPATKLMKWKAFAPPKMKIIKVILMITCLHISQKTDELERFVD